MGRGVVDDLGILEDVDAETESGYAAPEEVGHASIRKFAQAIGDLNPLYIDRKAAEAGPYGGVVAPPTFVCETTQYYRGDVDEEGGFADRLSLPFGQVIRGANEYTFHRPLRPDDVITARWRISDIYEREGRTGYLLFVVVDITYKQQHGELLGENRETLIYRVPNPKPDEGG